MSAPPQKELQQELAQSTLDGLESHIAILDEDGTVLAVNRAWRRFAEANAPNDVPDKLSPFLPGANYLSVCDSASGDCEASEAGAGIRSVLEGEQEIFTLEYPCHAPHEKRWFCLRVTRFPSDGPARVVVSHENITPRKQAELNLQERVEELTRATETLARRNRELDQFAYVASHDLRAPLRGIANLTRWIEEDMDGPANTQVSGHLELLRGRVSRMEGLIDGLLRLSRAGREALTPETVDAAALVLDVWDLLPVPDGFELELARPLPTLVTRKLLLQQVFSNLLSNALKHHHDPAHGKVCVSARAFARDCYEFTVSDNGPGIAPAFHDKVFEVFQTLRARDDVENTGIGLAIVQKIIEGRGGGIRVRSDEGKGAAFVFTWPAAIPAKEDSAKKETL